MSIAGRLKNYLSQFRLFNRHLRHGFRGGPDRSHFWLDLEWAYRATKNLGRELRDPALTSLENVLDYIHKLQHYKLLQVANYWRFSDAITVRDQLERSYARVLSEIKDAQVIFNREHFESEFKSLVCTATKMAFDSIMTEFEKQLNDDLRRAPWDTSYSH